MPAGVPTIDTTHGVTVDQWSNEVFAEYLAQNPFFNFMGTGSHNIIQVKEELTKAPGDSITMQLRAKLTGNGVSGITSLKGAEEDLVFYSHYLSVYKFQYAIQLDKASNSTKAAFVFGGNDF